MIAALFILKSLAVGAVTLLLILAFRKNSAATRHRTCMIGLLALVALPFVSISGWQMPLRVSESAGAISTVARPFTAVVPQASATAELPPPARPIFLPAPDAQPKTSLPLWSLWLVGAVICSIRPLAGALQARLLIRNAEPASPDLLALANNCAREQKVSGTLRVLTSIEVESALAWGYFKPVVMLPSSASSWSDDDLRTIFLHEFAHIARSDWLAQAFASAVCCLYWFNPFAWAMSARLRKEAERAADDLVLRCGVAPEAYANCLIQIARQLRRRPGPAGVAPILDPTQIENRIRGIMSKKINRGGITPLRSLAIAAVIACAALPMAAVFPYRLGPLGTKPDKSNTTSARQQSQHDLRSPVSKPVPGTFQTKTKPPTASAAASHPMEVAGGRATGAAASGIAKVNKFEPKSGPKKLNPQSHINPNFIEVGTGYVWIMPNANEELGLKHALNIGVTGYPRQLPPKNPRDGGPGRAGGALCGQREEGYFIYKENSAPASFEDADLILLTGEFTALIVPDDVTEADIQTTIEEAYRVNGTNADESPVRVFRQTQNGILVLFGTPVAEPSKSKVK